jgi:DNA-binding response OmpR family regulator
MFGDGDMTVLSQTLAGKRVLLVEDDTPVALLLEDLLMEVGCVPVASCSSVAKAMEAIGKHTFDLAVLDVNLNGERSYPIADALDERHIPFLFVSAYGDETAPPDHVNWKVCPKPFRVEDLAAMMCVALNNAGSACPPDAGPRQPRPMSFGDGLPQFKGLDRPADLIVADGISEK